MRPPFRFLPLLAATLLLTAGCGPSAPKDGAAPANAAAAAAPEMEADLKRTLAAEPEFYVFKPTFKQGFKSVLRRRLGKKQLPQ
jgi:hypothetical protein